MNNIIKISVVVTLALVVALFAGCGKKKTEEPKNESSILTGGDIEEIFGKDDEDTSDVGKVELVPGKNEDTVDAGALDKLESSDANSSESSSKDESSNDSSSKNESSSKNQSSSSKNQSSSSKNESSSKNDSSSSKNQSSSQTSSSSTGGLDKDNDSKTYTPGWI